MVPTISTYTLPLSVMQDDDALKSREQSQPEELNCSLTTPIKLEPKTREFVIGLNNVGVSHYENGSYSEALSCFEQASHVLSGDSSCPVSFQEQHCVRSPESLFTEKQRIIQERQQQQQQQQQIPTSNSLSVESAEERRRSHYQYQLYEYGDSEILPQSVSESSLPSFEPPKLNALVMNPFSSSLSSHQLSQPIIMSPEILHNTALIHYMEKNLNESTRLLRMALDVVREQVRPRRCRCLHKRNEDDDVVLSTILGALGEIYYQNNDNDNAARYLVASFRLDRKLLELVNVTTPSLGEAKNEQRGDQELAIPSTSGVTPFQSAESVAPIRHRLARTLSTLGHLRFSQGNFDGAMRCCEHRLEVQMTFLAYNNLDVASTLYNIGRCLHELRRCGGNSDISHALEHYRWFIMQASRTLGEGHTHVLKALGNMGVMLMESGSLGEAWKVLLDCHHRTLSLHQECLHKDVALTNFQLGQVKRKMGLDIEAIQHYQKALFILSEQQECGSSRCQALILWSLAQSQLSLRRYNDALCTYNTILESSYFTSSTTTKKKDSFRARVHIAIGVIHLERDDSISEAMSRFVSAKRISPSLPDRVYQRAVSSSCRYDGFKHAEYSEVATAA